jgi:SEC-C motif-containing protein
MPPTVETETVACPCGSGPSFEACCEPYLKGERLPPTAEALMRSRYTAFTLKDIDYVMNTHDPDTLDQVDRKGAETWAEQAKWLGFEVLGTERGDEADDTGSVEFIARYKVKGATIEHRERSHFRKLDGRWVFIDGQDVPGPPKRREEPRIGRNDPCPCGSGKKYKKCCGVAA